MSKLIQLCPKLLLCLLVLAHVLTSCKEKENTSPIPGLPVLHWETGDDIIITEDLYIDNVNFTIDPGVNVKIKSGCSIIVGENSAANLMFKGMAENPINFTTYNPENNPEENYWGNINIKSLYNDGDISIFENCNFIKGGGKGYEAVIINESKLLSITNCVIDYSMNFGIFSGNYGGFNDFHGNTIKHTLNHPIVIVTSSAHNLGTDNNILSDSLNHGILLTSESININSDSILWHAQTVPYIIPKGLSINGSSSWLTLEAGTKIMIGKDRDIAIHEGVKFTAAGVPGKPITFTSLEKEPQPGDWNCIMIYSETIAEFYNCIFEYGGRFDDYMVDNGMLELYSSTNITIEECVFRYSESTAILLYKSALNRPIPMFYSFKNNTFENLDGYAISLRPESVNSIDISNNFNNYPIYVQGETIEAGHIIWKDFGTDYLLDSYVSVRGELEPILEIEAGCIIKFERGGISVGGGMTYGGKLIAVGTEEKPIIFTSAKAEPYYGDWGCILFNTMSHEGTILDHCEILYAGDYEFNSREASVIIYNNGTNVSVTNCTIAHSSHYGLSVSSSSDPYLFNNTFFDNLDGGKK